MIRYEAESPDELALAEAAMAYGYELRNRTPEEVELGVRGELTKMKVLRVQQFDANRKAMSVAMRMPSGQVNTTQLTCIKSGYLYKIRLFV